MARPRARLPFRRFRRLASLGLAAAAWAGLACAAPAAAKTAPTLTVTLKADEATEACLERRSCVQRAFLQGVLGGSADAGEARLVKWQGPIRVGVLSGAKLARNHFTIAEQALNLMGMLGRQAGADLRSVRGDAKASINLIMFLSDDFKRDRDRRFGPIIKQVFQGNAAVYDSILGAGTGAVCRGQWFVDPSRSASGAVTMVESDLPLPEFERCIYSNVLKVLGMAGDLSRELDSVLSERAGRTSWTALDYVLLQILYHPKIKAGMTKEQILAVFPEVYADVKKSFS